jgi:hypothetical protein
MELKDRTKMCDGFGCDGGRVCYISYPHNEEKCKACYCYACTKATCPDALKNPKRQGERDIVYLTPLIKVVVEPEGEGFRAHTSTNAYHAFGHSLQLY